MEHKTSISFLIPILKGGGAERNIVNLISSLNPNKYRISILAGNAGGHLENDIPDHVAVIDLRAVGFLSLFFKLVYFLKKEKPDILFSALPHINTISMMASMFSRSKTKVILTEHTTFSLIPSTARTFFKKYMAKYILPVLMRFFYSGADAIVCVSQGVANDIRAVVGNLSTISVIYNPVTSEKIYQQAKESLGSDEHLFSAHQLIILAVGRLVKAKDYPTLLKAFALVLPIIDARLIILGEGPEEHNLKELVLRLNISQNVNFLGFKGNPYAYMARASVFVLSSIREGFGNVIVEAMACHVPVIATNCQSGPREIIEEGVNGFLVPVGDEKYLANTIIKIFQNPLLAKKIADAGYQRAKYFSIEKSAGAYEKIFSRILAGG